MTARIGGFISRADAGLRLPRSFSRNITPSQGGVGVHYGGPKQPAAGIGADHGICTKTWRDWQAFHMGPERGWVDIAYSGGFCNHGFAFAGRGAGVRTAANGTDFGNQNFYAVTWIGGDGQRPTAAAIDALEWWIVELRRLGAGLAVKPHRWFKSTGCPGDSLVPHAKRLDGVRFATTPEDDMTPEQDAMLRKVFTELTTRLPNRMGLTDPATGEVGTDTLFGAALWAQHDAWQATQAAREAVAEIASLRAAVEALATAAQEGVSEAVLSRLDAALADIRVTLVAEKPS